MDLKKTLLSVGGIKSAMEAGPEGPAFPRLRSILVPLGLVALVTVVVRLTGFDLLAQQAIYAAGGDSWDFGKGGLWQFLYWVGPVPAALVCLFALVGFLIGLVRTNWWRWRFCFIFILLLGVIGPGIVSNLIFKEHWGRPRPRHVEAMGGQNAFEPVLTIDKSSSGKSFPCGHATMGYFFVGGFFLFRRYRRFWAWAFLVFGLIFGFLIGVARMCQGGHFFSDVIWAGTIIYFVAMILDFALQLQTGVVREVGSKPLPLWAKIAVPIAGVGLLIGILHATPYKNYKSYKLTEEHAKQGPLNFRLHLVKGNVTIVPGDEFLVEGDARGHGVPTSRIDVHFLQYDQKDSSMIIYKERVSGRFTELDQDLVIKLPWHRLQNLSIEPNDCVVTFAFPEVLQSESTVLVGGGNGELRFKSLPDGFSWHDQVDKDQFGIPSDLVGEGMPEIDVSENFSGKIEILR